MLNWGKYLRAALQKVAEKEAILENCDLRNGVNIFFGPMSVSELNNMTIIRPMFNRRSPRSGFVQWNLPETGIFSESSFNVEIRLLPQIVDFRFVPQTVPAMRPFESSTKMRHAGSTAVGGVRRQLVYPSKRYRTLVRYSARPRRPAR